MQGYRLPAAARLGRVRLQIADLQRSLAFYTGVLGLRELDVGSGRAVLGAGDNALVELAERRGIRPVPRKGRLGLFHVALLLPDRPSLARFVHHLAENGVRAGMSDHLVSEAIYLTDPDGLGVEVYADRPRSQWRRIDGQIEMTTEPLDLRSLADAAGSATWSGAPEGTTVGHVHLRVADLESAQAFYHAALGFDKTLWTYPGALFFSTGGYHHHLGTNVWGGRLPRASDEDARLLEWKLILPTGADAEQAAESLAATGFHVETHAGDFMTADPSGTPLRIHGHE